MNILVKFVTIIIISILNTQIDVEESYSITVTVDSIESNDGKIFFALYNKETNFLDEAFKGTKNTIENNQCTVTFKNIPEGVYAVSIFHDENNNGKMDTNFIGIPKEDYGCSNNASGFMGPPKWSDAKFELKADQTLSISL
jgi:uncharacterized protein (DUF2141 family)